MTQKQRKSKTIATSTTPKSKKLHITSLINKVLDYPGILLERGCSEEEGWNSLRLFLAIIANLPQKDLITCYKILIKRKEYDWLFHFRKEFIECGIPLNLKNVIKKMTPGFQHDFIDDYAWIKEHVKLDLCDLIIYAKASEECSMLLKDMTEDEICRCLRAPVMFGNYTTSYNHLWSEHLPEILDKLSDKRIANLPRTCFKNKSKLNFALPYLKRFADAGAKKLPQKAADQLLDPYSINFYDYANVLRNRDVFATCGVQIDFGEVYNRFLHNIYYYSAVQYIFEFLDDAIALGIRVDISGLGWALINYGYYEAFCEHIKLFKEHMSHDDIIEIGNILIKNDYFNISYVIQGFY